MSIDNIINAALSGNTDAQQLLGFYYYNGNEFEKDIQEAIFWYEKAAAQGNDAAMCHLAEHYNETGQYKESEWICKLKGKFLNGQSNADEIFAFSKLISVISQYIPDTCTNDESDNHLFTVTCMLAEALIDFATSADDIKTVEGETILKADGKDGSHKIMYYPDGMVTVYKNEPTGDSQFSEYNDGYLVYDFDIGDYSEFVDYANYISENEEEFEPDII